MYITLDATRMDDACLLKTRTLLGAAAPPIFECIETPELQPGARIKISEKTAVKSGMKRIAVGRQTTTECFFRGAGQKSFLMKKS
jgi:hypothetical protein